MKKKNRDSQKASELLQKLQEAVLSSSQKKEVPSEEPDRDELEFQKKIASMLSRITEDKPSNEKKKKAAKSTAKQTELPPPPTVEEIAETVEEISEPIMQEVAEQPKKKKAKRSNKCLVSAPVQEQPEPPSEVEAPITPYLPEAEEIIQPLPADETESILSDNLTPSEETEIALADDLVSSEEIVVEASKETTADVSVSEIETDTPIQPIANEEHPTAEELICVQAPTEEIENEAIPQVEKPLPKPAPAPIPPQPKKPLVTVIKPKPFEPTPQTSRDDTIVIKPKNPIRPTEPIVIKPKKPSRATEPIRVEVKTPCQIPRNGSDHPLKKTTIEKN